MAMYKLSEQKIRQLENILIETPPRDFKKICKAIYSKNYEQLKQQFLETYEGDLLLWKLKRYDSVDAAADANGALFLTNSHTMRNFYNNVRNGIGNISNALSQEDNNEFVTCWELKEKLYRILSYCQAYRSGYKDITLSFSEMNDVEDVIQLWDSGETLELIAKYSKI